MSQPYADQQYEEALLEARSILWKLARLRTPVACCAFADKIEAIRISGKGSRFRDFLNDICRRENELLPDAPMLTAVVYSAHRNRPGPGFFDFLAEKYDRGEVHDAERRKVWRGELSRLYDYAERHPELP